MKVLAAAPDLMAVARIRNGAFPAEVALYYLQLAPQLGLDVRFAFAQMAHETGWWTSRASREWLNPAGLGVTGAPDVGIRYPTIQAGVRAHLAHLLSYFGDHGPWCAWNPPRPEGRHFGAGWEIGMDAMPVAGGTVDRRVTTDATGHLHLVNGASELDGRWAQGPRSEGYGGRVATIAEMFA